MHTKREFRQGKSLIAYASRCFGIGAGGVKISQQRSGPPERLRPFGAASFAWLAEPKLTLRR